VGYLEEQRDVVLDALRHGGDLIARKREPWGTTIWTRTADDAATLRDMLHEAVRAHAVRMEGAVTVEIGLVEDDARCGVRVELRFPDR
jgi:hypothetical protein